MPQRVWRFDQERDGLTHWEASLYVLEIAQQCGHARRAFIALRKASQRQAVWEVWYHVQALLTAVGVVSPPVVADKTAIR